ncbi:MAG TPA: hypothetical protein VLK53_08450 [Gaiellaceae bacterium]|nr:hypothetical protein [Gaiellaceae bacterium]
MRRTLHALAACAALACVLAGAGRAAPGLLVGMDDDTLKWAEKPQAQKTLSYARDLGIRAVRVTVPWHPGDTRLGVDDRIPVDRMILATWAAHFRVVLAVYGAATDAPQTDAARDSYCTFVGNLLRRYPGVVDVVIWNEPNTGRFWRPQFDADGQSVGPANYEVLLAHCYDVLHRVRPNINVIAASSPHGNNRPWLSASASHSPIEFYRKIGEAYRASGRAVPIFDTVGHNPYPTTNGEPPWTRHAGGTIGEGDYDKLMAALTEAFGGTGQPLPGQRNVSIWYMEQGFQTTVDAAKASLYSGVETDRHRLPPTAARTTAGTSDGLAADQATQLTDALRMAYCQPGVAAFFNFEIADEPGLGGWQSGLLWTDFTPKPSYQPFKDAVRTVASRQMDCNRYNQLSVGAATGAGAAAGAEIGFSSGPDKPQAPTRPAPPPKKKIRVFTVK